MGCEASIRNEKQGPIQTVSLCFALACMIVKHGLKLLCSGIQQINRLKNRLDLTASDDSPDWFLGLVHVIYMILTSFSYVLVKVWSLFVQQMKRYGIFSGCPGDIENEI